MPDINSQDVIDKVRETFPEYTGVRPQPGSVAIGGTVSVNGKPVQFWLNTRIAGKRIAEEGCAEFIVSEIQRFIK